MTVLTFIRHGVGHALIAIAFFVHQTGIGLLHAACWLADEDPEDYLEPL